MQQHKNHYQNKSSALTIYESKSSALTIYESKSSALSIYEPKSSALSIIRGNMYINNLEKGRLRVNENLNLDVTFTSIILYIQNIYRRRTPSQYIILNRDTLEIFVGLNWGPILDQRDSQFSIKKIPLMKEGVDIKVLDSVSLRLFLLMFISESIATKDGRKNIPFNMSRNHLKYQVLDI
jgi:hypothetical protein